MAQWPDNARALREAVADGQISRFQRRGPAHAYRMSAQNGTVSS